MPALPGVLGLEVVRHYNSSYSRAYVPPGLLGRGWLLSYEARLYDHLTNLQIVRADGTRIIFSKLREHPSLCASEQPGNGIVRIEGTDTKGTKETTPGQERHYTWQWMDGRELRFNHRGRLTRISLPSGEQVRLDYNAKGNRLLKVTDPQGRSLRLHYAQSSGEDSFTGVQAIDTPLGRIGYRHGSALLPGSTQPQAKLNASLVQVSLPSADGQAPVQRHYHYEDPRHPTLLTGISVQGQGSDGKPMDERIASYAYGDTGRAILSVRGPPDSHQEEVTLDLSQPWKNTLTNSLGQTTTYHYDTIGKQWRLLEVRGPGCASCGPGDMRYRYDAQGRLTDATRLDPAGRPLEGTRTELDYFVDRPLAVYRIPYTQGQARAPQLQVRYGYGKDPWKQYAPELIARPSVVPGREHQIRIRYNSSRQPLQITEAGFSPLDAQGQPAGNADGAMPIERSTRYRYTEINGRSVLVDIDGPLPTSLAGYDDGSPAQNDLTRLRWDRSGSHVTRVLQPDGTAVALEHDQAGRITTRTEDDGVRRLQRQMRYSALSANALQAEEITTSGWLLDADGQPRASSRLSLNPYRIRHDALGRPSQAIDTAGRSITWAYQGSTQARLDGLGNRGQIERDSEGRIKRLGLYREGQDLPERAAYYGWKGRADGSSTHYQYAPSGRLLAKRYEAAPGQIVALPRKPCCTTRAGCCRPSTATGSASPSNTTPWAAPWHAPLGWPRPTARPSMPIAPPRAMARTAGSTAAPWPMAACSSPGAAPPAKAPACKGCNCKALGWPACCRPATTGWAPAPQACLNACCPRRRWSATSKRTPSTACSTTRQAMAWPPRANTTLPGASRSRPPGKAHRKAHHKAHHKAAHPSSASATATAWARAYAPSSRRGHQRACTRPTTATRASADWCRTTHRQHQRPCSATARAAPSRTHCTATPTPRQDSSRASATTRTGPSPATATTAWASAWARPCTRAMGKRTATTCGRTTGSSRKWMAKAASPASTCT
ncbi:DUF6531 domain-containing protein [Delftia sp.]|uniref:DUF6531 domain-containing protein n=1 Tax=Delftia sp. TaxID=1886637 RepID=UPI00259C81C1|nr:DUF6531 domain-containing protein [Delftia sp.]